MKTFNALLVSGALAVSPLLAHADDQSATRGMDSARGRMGDARAEGQYQHMLERASEVYGAIAKGSNREVPRSVLSKAQCVAIIPGVVTGALVVGGSHGEGVASCKTGAGTWSQPAPISLNQGSIGLQAGAKSADLVIYFQSNKSVEALKSGAVTISADVSAVAGKYDASVDNTGAGMVVYSRAEGVFAGVSVTGGKITKDQDALSRFYGSNADYAALLDGRSTPDTTGNADRLTKLFPN